MQLRLRARERLPLEGSSRSGAMPEPTVKVRMKENARAGPLRVGAHVIALGDVSVTGKEITMTHTRYRSGLRIAAGTRPVVPLMVAAPNERL
jgi:hypothetical protein